MNQHCLDLETSSTIDNCRKICISSAHPTVNDELPNRIAAGTIRVKPQISRFTERGLEFDDGSTVGEVDTVIFATGYSFEFPVLEKGELVTVSRSLLPMHHIFSLDASYIHFISGERQQRGSVSIHLPSLMWARYTRNNRTYSGAQFLKVENIQKKGRKQSSNNHLKRKISAVWLYYAYRRDAGTCRSKRASRQVKVTYYGENFLLL